MRPHRSLRDAQPFGGVQVSEGFVAKLTERKGLTPAQIRTAVRFAGLIGSGEEKQA